LFKTLKALNFLGYFTAVYTILDWHRKEGLAL